MASLLKPLGAINDLRRHNRPLDAKFREAFERILESGWYVLGNEVAAFEREFAEYCGVSAIVGVANGTDALELALRAVGTRRGDSVALVANAGGYGSAAVRAIGAQPVYVDVQPATFNMDPAALVVALARHDVRAVIVTHLYGRLASMAEIAAVSSAGGIKLIEDCAQAHGAADGAKRAGSWGDAACFSFYPTKNLGALGDGGAVAANDPAIAERLRQLRQYGWQQKYRSTLTGGRNSRLDEFQAALLRIKLPYLDQWNARRSAIAKLYGSLIHHPKLILPEVAGSGYVAHLYVVRAAERSSLSRHLAALAIPHDIHYPLADYRQPAYADRYAHIALPVTDLLCSEVLTLPCFPEMSDQEVATVAAALNQWRP